MTESDWQSCTDPKPMLEFLRGKVSDRKLRLWGCACCLKIRDLFPNESYFLAVQAAERVADRLAEPGELQSHHLRIVEDHGSSFPASPAADAIQVRVLEAVAAVTSSEQSHLEYALWFNVALALEGRRLKDLHNEEADPLLVQWLEATSLYDHDTKQFLQWADLDPRPQLLALLHDLIGNPFRPVTLDSGWRTSTVTALAQSAYNERIPATGTLDNDRLAVLADALEEAGCVDITILEHLRGPGPHVRGCFVLDLLLDKN